VGEITQICDHLGNIEPRSELKHFFSCSEQGDHIKRIFSYGAIVFLWAVLYHRRRPNFLATFFNFPSKIYVLFSHTTCWAASWAIFSQTHQVTLVPE
jgi:flagellar biosynthesis protein FlhB